MIWISALFELSFEYLHWIFIYISNILLKWSDKIDLRLRAQMIYYIKEVLLKFSNSFFKRVIKDDRLKLYTPMLIKKALWYYFFPRKLFSLLFLRENVIARKLRQRILRIFSIAHVIIKEYLRISIISSLRKSQIQIAWRRYVEQFIVCNQKTHWKQTDSYERIRYWRYYRHWKPRQR